MIQEIKTVADVSTFFSELLAEDLNFHPDTPFTEYVNITTDEPTYTSEEAGVRSKLLDQAFEICENSEVDIHELCNDIFMADFYRAFPPEE